MAFSNLIAGADPLILAALGDITVTIHFQDRSPDVTRTMISKNPKFEEDYIPGTQSPQGTSNLILWDHLAFITPFPRKGDTATVAGVDYDIWQVDADREGGGTLRLRTRAQRWDQ